MFNFEKQIRSMSGLNKKKKIKALKGNIATPQKVFDCTCDIRTKLVGDGCQICNTELAIDLLPQPAELADELSYGGGFSEDQAETIASEIYQPLMSLIATLSGKIDQLAK